jgi:trimethylamine--corrinoid protein Co-methyltransferase
VSDVINTAASQGRRRAGSRRDKIARKTTASSRPSRKPSNLSLTLIDDAAASRIHSAVIAILSEVGVVIEHPGARDMLVHQHGCRLGEDGYLRLPEALIQQALGTVPDTVRLFDRNGACVVDTSSNMTAFAPGHNCVRLLDHRSGELRPCTLADIVEVARVCDQLANISMTATLGYPSDIAAEDEAVEATRAMLDHSSKPIIMLAHDEHIQARMYAMLTERAGTEAAFADKPFALELMGPISPLKLPEELCERLINCARWRLPVVCYPATFPGMSSPITTAGAIAQSSAEAIAGIIIHQLTEPGAPVMSGSAILPMDMRQADLAYGSPEYLLTGLGACDYFRAIGIPSWVGAGCSDSHDFDAQAAAEAGAGMAIAALARTPFVHNLGFLSGGRTGSLEMLVLCDELAGWATQMAAGVDTSPEAIALEVVRRAAPDNAYLTDPHTQDRFLTENWYPNLFERSDADAWLERGSVDMRSRIRQRLAEILDD